jgi:hypothetical protein
VTRRIEPEWLDELPADDPRARASREDLKRLNAIMGNARRMARALAGAWDDEGANQILELGAGDGYHLLQVARCLYRSRKAKAAATLVDRHLLLQPETRAGFDRLGWPITAIEADLFQSLESPAAGSREVVVANLVLHHFEVPQLTRLFQLVAQTGRQFVAVEPRRSRLALCFSRCVGAIGCHPVTRHDAMVSVRAGFNGQELSGLWPRGGGWTLSERRAGWFSHLFVAQRPK